MRLAKEDLRRQIEEEHKKEEESSLSSSKYHLSLKLLLITFTIIGTSFIGSSAYYYAHRQERKLQMDLSAPAAVAAAFGIPICFLTYIDAKDEYRAWQHRHSDPRHRHSNHTFHDWLLIRHPHLSKCIFPGQTLPPTPTPEREPQRKPKQKTTQPLNHPPWKPY